MFKIGVTDRFSFFIVGVFYLATTCIGYFVFKKEKELKTFTKSDQKMLVHLVLIQFKPEISSQDLQQITDAAYALQAVPGVSALNFSENVSPEGFNQEYTHSLTMKFPTAIARDSVYLPHSLHQNFVDLFIPLTEKILVYDFWE